MVPTFGFSVGDFISAIDLTVKISKALREASGAPAECRAVIQELQNLRQILELLQDLRPAGGSISHVNAIRGVALTCIIPLRDFSEKIDRHYSLIASPASSSSDQFLRRGGKKARWAVFASEEVAKFRSVIAAKVASVTLLLNIMNSESLARIESQNRESQNYLLAKTLENRESLERHFSRLAIHHQEKVSDEVRDARQDVKNAIVDIDGRSKVRHDALLKEADQHTDKLEQLDCQGQAVLRQTKSMRMAWTNLLGCLVPFSEKILRYLQENVKANMEIYALLLRMQSIMPQGVGNGDKIYFVDVLGRTKALPYEYFHHWEVFESMLRCEFKGLPGEQKVLRNQYLLWSGLTSEGYIGSDTWHQMVFPESKVKMSVLMDSLGAHSGQCPRPGCHGTAVVNRAMSVHQCPVCHLIFIPEQPTLASNRVRGTEWLAASDISNNAPLKTLLSQETPLGGAEGKRARRMARQLKAHEEAERELQESRVFRMIHLSKSLGGMQGEHLTREDQSSLSIIQEGAVALAYEESEDIKWSFEDLYRESYQLVLGARGKLLYDNLASMIPGFVEDSVEEPLRAALMQENNLLALSEISFIWLDFRTTFASLTDFYFYLVSKPRRLRFPY